MQISTRKGIFPYNPIQLKINDMNTQISPNFSNMYQQTSLIKIHLIKLQHIHEIMGHIHYQQRGQNSLKISKGKSEAVTRRTDNAIPQRQKDNCSQNTCQKSKDSATLKTRCTKRVSRSCSYSTSRDTYVKNPVIRQERGLRLRQTFPKISVVICDTYIP